MHGNLSGKGASMYHFFLKNRKLHKYPVPERCGVKYDDEKLWDYIVDDAEECIYCLRRWPGDEA